VVVCAVTTAPHRANDPGNVELDKDDGDLPKYSIVNVSQIIAVDKMRLLEWIGSLSEDKMRRVMGGIRQVLEGEDLGL
jgi:mRNA interferase MazF